MGQNLALLILAVRFQGDVQIEIVLAGRHVHPGEGMGAFSATGGIITLCAGLSLAGIKKDMKVLNLLPSLILIFLISSAWTALMG